MQRGAAVQATLLVLVLATGLLTGCAHTPHGPKYSVLIVDVQHADASCDGETPGYAVAEPTGGTPPFRFRWSDGQQTATAFDLAAGHYSVRVIDARHRKGIGHVTIGRGDEIAVEVIATGVSCAGARDGTATAVVTATDTPLLTYLWDDPLAQTSSTATRLDAGEVSVEVTSAGGCSGTASAIIEQPPPLDLEFEVSHASCDGTSIGGSTAAHATGGTPPYSISWHTDPPPTASCATACVIGVAPGTYTAVVADANGCYLNQEATIYPAGSLRVATRATPVTCGGGSDGTATAIATGGTPPYSYAWSDPAGQTTATASELAPGTYQVTVADSSSPHTCTLAATAVVGDVEPLAVAISSRPAACGDGAGGEALAAASGGTPPYAYRWTASGGGIVPAGQDTGPAASGLIPGIYTVMATDAGGCSAVSEVEIQGAGDLTLTVDVVDAACQGAANGTATVAASGGTPPYAFAWSTAPVQHTATATELAPGSYRVTVEDAGGCHATAIATVGGDFEPRVSVSRCGTSFGWLYLNLNVADAATICAGDCVQLKASGGTTYAWSPQAGLSDPGVADPVATPTASTTYTVDAASGACSEQMPVAVDVLPNPPIEISPPVTICPGDSVELQASGGAFYRWHPAHGLDDPSSPNPLASPEETTTYQVTVTDENGCQSSAETSVVVGPDIAVSPDRTICRGQPVTLAATGKPGLELTWLPDDGSLSCLDCSHPTATPERTTTYRVTARDPECPGLATATGEVTIKVIDDFEIAAVATPPSVCLGEAAELGVEVTGAAPPGLAFQWTPAAGLSDPGTRAPLASPRADVTYTVTATGGSCRRTASVDLEVIPPPEVTASSDVAVCPDDLPTEVPLAVTGGAPDAVYGWSPTHGLSDPAIADPILSLDLGSATTTYRVTVTDRCASTASVTVAVGGTTASLDGDFRSCPGGAVRLRASGGVSYRWRVAGGTLSCDDCPDPVIRPLGEAGSEAVTSVTVTDALGCQTRLDHTVAVAEPLIVEAPEEILACPGRPVVLEAEIRDAADERVDVLWSPTAGLSCTDCLAPTATVSDAATYTVTAFQGGCSANDQARIRIDPAARPSLDFEIDAADPARVELRASPESAELTYDWDFGDGDAISGQGAIAEPGLNDGRTTGRFDRPVHVYQAAGSYRVCLTVTGACGPRTVCDLVSLEDVPCADCDEEATP